MEKAVKEEAMNSILKRKSLIVPVIIITLFTLIASPFNSVKIQADTPIVVTLAASNIGPDTATLSGNLTNNGTAESVILYFGYATDAYYSANGDYDQWTENQTVSSPQSFSAIISDLEPGTLYHFKAFADGGVSGNVAGADKTLITPPFIRTQEATNVRFNTATLNGNLVDIGTAESAILYFEYTSEADFNINHTYSYTTPKQTISEAGIFSADIAGLAPGTTYHFMAFAVADYAVHGNDVPFTTDTMAPVVSTLEVKASGRNSATLSGNLLEIGTNAFVAVGFDWGISTNYGNTFFLTQSNVGIFTDNLIDLTAGTTYHFRAFADDGIHPRVYGIDRQFTTDIISIVVETLSATNITTNSTTLNGMLDSLGTVGAVNVSFEYGVTDSYGSATDFVRMTATGNFTLNISGLNPGTIYHFRAKADGGSLAIGYSEDMIFTTLTSPPIVNAEPASQITYNTATLNGNLISMGTAPSVDVIFQWGLTTDYGNKTTVQTLSAAGGFYANLSGLEPGTVYHFRVRADGGVHGVAYGLDTTLITFGVIPPGVSTLPASDISYDRVTLKGTLYSMGTADVIKVYFKYGTGASYSSNTTMREMTATGNFAIDVSGLSPNTTYHFQAWADGGLHGMGYGADLIFTTLPVTPPAVTTDAASNISYDRATLNGSLESLGTAGTVKVYFEYGLTPSGDSVTTFQSLTATGNFAFVVDSLSANTTYYFRAIADGGIHGIQSGNDTTFTTLAVTPPTVTTAAASNLSYDRATLNGNLGSLGTASQVNVLFEYGLTDSYGSFTTIKTMTATGNYFINIDGLTPSTLYYFRAIADGGIHGIEAGEDMSFTTLAATTPEVTTAAATAVNFDRATLNGNLDSLGTAGMVNVCFEYGPTTSYGSTTPIQIMTATGSFIFNITGLSQGMTYHFRARADGGIHGLKTGADMTFTTLSPPIIRTGTATDITYGSVTLHGNLISLGTAASVVVFFEYGQTASYGTTTATRTFTSSGTGAFSISLDGLLPGTAYHFRVSATGGINGYATGSDMTFSTLTPPNVETNDATGIALSTAILNGDLIALGTASTASVSFEYGTTVSYGSTTTIHTMTTPGALTADLSALTAGTTYHFRIKADAGIHGSSHGADMTFTTLKIAPVASTSPASGIGTTFATLNGYLGSLGTATAVNIYFEYGPTTGYGWTITGPVMTAPGLFSADLSGLQPGTTYHFRVKADGSSQGTTYGMDMVFTTTVTPPNVSTLESIAVASDSTTIAGNLLSLGTAGTVNVYFEYGLTTAYGSATMVQVKTVTGTFNADLSGLLPGTVYHYRADASSINGTANGTDMTFTTANAGTTPPSVDTLDATAVATSSATLNANLSSLGTAGAVDVSYEYGLTTVYSNVVNVTSTTAAGHFEANLSGLDPGTNYHFRALAYGGVNGRAAGADMTFTTTTIPPNATTLTATSITANSATLNGNLTSLGTAGSVNIVFQYGKTASYGSTTTNQTVTAAGIVQADVTGLTPATIYHFRIRVDGGSQGLAYGADATFTTANAGTVAPSVGTLAATLITPNSATISGNLTSLGSAGTVFVYFEYGTTAGYGASSTVQSRNTTGVFTLNLTNLTPGTTYHFRTNADGGDVNGNATGADMSFTTTIEPPVVNTLPVASVTTNSATISGNLTSLGSAGTVNVFFEYGPDESYGSTTATQAKTTLGAFNAILSGLQPGVSYHYRAYADAGTSGNNTGDDETFETATILPQASTLVATAISADSATLNGNASSLGTAGSVTITFRYGTTEAYGLTTSNQTSSVTGLFSAKISDLTPATEYHYLIEVNGGIHGTCDGSDQTFVTANDGTIPPMVTTLESTAITAYSATISGNVTSLGTAEAINVYFEYGTTNIYGSRTTFQTLTANGTTFSFNVSNLSPNTVYHFRADADADVNGTANGMDETLTTASPPSTGFAGGGFILPAITAPSKIEGTGTVDVSNGVSKEGVFSLPVTLQSEDGQALLSIAKDTVAHSRDGKIISSITVTQLKTDLLPPPPAGQNIISIGYNFEPAGATFDPPISLTIKYDPAGLETGTKLLVAFYDNALKEWVSLTDFTIDSKNNQITVRVAHFTTFAVLAQSEVAPAPSPTPTPTTTPTPTPTPSPEIEPTPVTTTTPAVGPAPVKTPTPTTPSRTVPASSPQSKAGNTLWLIGIAVIVALVIMAVMYILISRKRGKAIRTDFTSIFSKDKSAQTQDTGQTEDNGPNTTLYEGIVKLIIRPPVFLSQMQALKKCLSESTDLRVESVGGSSNESNIVISIDKNKPLYLVNILRAMPPVKYVSVKNNQIYITLHPPLSG